MLQTSRQLPAAVQGRGGSLFPGHAACKGAIVKTSDVVKRYGCLSVSLFFNALGIALITQAHLGTTPITTLPYTLAAIFGLTLGTTTFACNLLFLLLQRILLRRRLGIAELLQIPAVLIFSVFIDFWMHLTGALVTDVYVWQIVMCIVGSAVLGAGISLEIMSNATVIPGEGLVIVIAARSRKNFGNIKVLFDCSLVLASCLLGLAVLGSIVGLREGTVLSAVLVGMFARLTSPWTRKLKPLLWSPEQRRLLRQIKAEMPPRQEQDRPAVGRPRGHDQIQTQQQGHHHAHDASPSFLFAGVPPFGDAAVSTTARVRSLSCAALYAGHPACPALQHRASSACPPQRPLRPCGQTGSREDGPSADDRTSRVPKAAAQHPIRQG